MITQNFEENTNREKKEEKKQKTEMNRTACFKHLRYESTILIKEFDNNYMVN